MAGLSEEIRQVRLELLKSQLSLEGMKVAAAELELAKAKDMERDRLARPGLQRHYPFVGSMVGTNTTQLIEALEHWRVRDPGEPVTVSITTPGGSVIDGFAMYDQIQRLRREGSEVTLRAVGMAMSMGAILLQAASDGRRVIDPNAILMVHSISGGASGKLAEIKNEARMMERLEERALDILSARSVMTRATIKRRWAKEDWYLTAEDALKAGFVDAIE